MTIKTQAEAKRILKTFGVSSLLAKPESNPKLAKGTKLGVLSAPLHLAPANLSGYEVCPMASNGCRAACLHSAGNPAYMAGKERARIARTRMYFQARDLFMSCLAVEIKALVKKAKRLNMEPAVRLNATSDIPWERVKVQGFRNVMEMFPEVTFYDYTKRCNRKDIPANYHLTFSLAEDNDADAMEAFHRGMNVAVVFDVRRGQPLPETYGGSPVIDGDEHDFRPLDPRGVIVGLRAKGDAIGDKSGFVRAANG